MKILILSYRPDYDTYHCGHREGGNSASFEVSVAETEEEAANFIANRIREDDDAEFAHLIFSSWEDIIGWAGDGYFNTEKGEKSINAPGGYAETEEEEARESERNGLCWNVIELTGKRLGILSEEAKRKAEEERRREYERQQKKAFEEREARDRAEFERLSKKFQPEGK